MSPLHEPTCTSTDSAPFAAAVPGATAARVRAVAHAGGDTDASPDVDPCAAFVATSCSSEAGSDRAVGRHRRAAAAAQVREFIRAQRTTGVSLAVVEAEQSSPARGGATERGMVVRRSGPGADGRLRARRTAPAKRFVPIYDAEAES